jgi:dTMP kinase
MTKRGIFIVIEGIDGSGTTTQCALLAHSLEARGIACRATREPSDGPIGRLIRGFLEKRETPLREIYGDELAERDTLALLFTADRMDHLHRVVIPQLNSGAAVVSDRYMHSTCAYQMKDRAHLDWIVALHKHALVPDLTVFIDLPPDTALERIAKRERSLFASDEEIKRELFETREQLERIRASYLEIIGVLEARGDRIATVDGRPATEQIHAAIMNELSCLL